VPQPPDHAHWQDRAACAADDRFTTDDVTEPVVEALALVCRACPVMQQCGAFAADVGATWGCWAGQCRTQRTPAATPTADLSNAPRGNYPPRYPDHPATARPPAAQVPSRCPADTGTGAYPGTGAEADPGATKLSLRLPLPLPMGG